MITVRCRLCREEFVSVESHDDEALCLRCAQIIRPYEQQIAELRAAVRSKQWILCPACGLSIVLAKCPVCDGQGTQSRPPWLPEDQPRWSNTGTGPYPCQTCHGRGIVVSHPTNPSVIVRTTAPATFCGWQTRRNSPPLALFTLTAPIPGHPEGSTVSAETLIAAGYGVVTLDDLTACWSGQA